MARVPIEEGYFRIPDDPDAPPVLLGSKCPNCGEVFFPRRMVCAQCLHEGTEDVDLSTRVLRVKQGTRLLRTMRVGTGASGTATPTGRFAITDKLAGARFSAVYGCCILALSGHQTNLPPGWTGGDRLAIHGGSTAGAVSTGCLHAAETDLRWLMRVVPLGAQITIRSN